jgi:hypothetical protein
MRAVSRFEANLLRVLHALLQQAPVERILPILAKPTARPKCLSRDAVALLEDALSKGCVQFLARRGWMRERFLHAGKTTEGRLWQRAPPDQLGLTFSAHTLEFLVQIVSGTIGSASLVIDALTIGDRLLLVLAFDALKHTDSGKTMRDKWTPLQQDGLCRLAFVGELADSSQRFRIDWQPWLTGMGTSILECLQTWLADRWVELERQKETISTVARMRTLGAAQQRVCGEYLDALDLAQRRDLARCFLDASRRLLKDQPTARRWIRSLDASSQRLAQRTAVYRDALAFVRQMERLAQWQQQALGVGYFDDGYEASQLWKSDWERCGGDELCDRARTIVREVAP